MSNILINNERFNISDEMFKSFCENFKKRVIKILYLKDDVLSGKINKSDMFGYINALIWDIYGAYTVFENIKFLNCICELEGIKEHMNEDFTRKKVLDLASYIKSIAVSKE